MIGQSSILGKPWQGLFIQIPTFVPASQEIRMLLSSGYKEDTFHIRFYDLFQEVTNSFLHILLLKFFQLEIFNMRRCHILGQCVLNPVMPYLSSLSFSLSPVCILLSFSSTHLFCISGLSFFPLTHSVALYTILKILAEVSGEDSSAISLVQESTFQFWTNTSLCKVDGLLYFIFGLV